MLRMFSVGAAIVLWGFSVNFSADGFNFNTENMKFAGILLAICITIVELVWTKAAEGNSTNMVIFLCGLIAYSYGVVTNVVGLGAARGVTNFMENPVAYGVPLVAGLILEILPEPLLVWGLLGEFWGGDFLSGMFGSPGSHGKQHQPSYPQGTPVSDYSQRFSPNGSNDRNRQNYGGNDRGRQSNRR